MQWIWRYCQQVMAVFDIAPIKWAAENHRLSLAPTLRWWLQPPLSLSDADASTSNIPLQENKHAIDFASALISAETKCIWQDSFCCFVIGSSVLSFSTGIALVLVSSSGLNIHTHKLYRRTERSFDFNEETSTNRETWGLLLDMVTPQHLQNLANTKEIHAQLAHIWAEQVAQILN